jgi:hypothetical protein
MRVDAHVKILNAHMLNIRPRHTVSTKQMIYTLQFPFDISLQHLTYFKFAS